MDEQIGRFDCNKTCEGPHDALRWKKRAQLFQGTSSFTVGGRSQSRVNYKSSERPFLIDKNRTADGSLESGCVCFTG